MTSCEVSGSARAARGRASAAAPIVVQRRKVRRRIGWRDYYTVRILERREAHATFRSTMAKKAKSGDVGPRLEALHAVGDLRAVRAEASRVLGAPEATEEQRAAARAALRWTGPERAAAAAAAIGIAFFAAVAVAGILSHR